MSTVDFKINDFSLDAVTIMDEYCVNAFEKEVEYLVRFDVDRLLAGFRETAGLDMKGAERYPGWENMLIGGHCVGHYLGACANAIITPNCSDDNRIKLIEILSDFIDGLYECQHSLGTGFIFGAKCIDKNNVEIQFDNVEKNLTHIITQAWVPWYTMHKLIEGLIAVSSLNNFEFQGGQTLGKKSLDILSNLINWIYNRVSKWDDQIHRTVLNIEYGGMNDCLYSYYLISGNKKALECAKKFDDEALFKKIASAEEGQNILAGRHANTTIPKFIGSVNRYLVTGEKEFLDYGISFWNLVTKAHTYVNGGNSTWEHFGEDNNLYSKLSNCNCETCNSYNMLKLTKLLFMITGEKKYADWYEHTFINSILSSQNPESGMTTYFQPMASGYFKVYSSPFDSFWCCTGTGMENFSKLGESFYFMMKDSDSSIVVINQYISSKLEWKEKNLNLIQKSSIPLNDYSEFLFENDYDGAIAFRIPEWVGVCPLITIDDKPYNSKNENGFILIKSYFKKGCKIKITLPMKIKAYNLPDQQDAWAFKYGPVVLCALLGMGDGKTAINGVNVAVPEKTLISDEYIPSKSDIVTVKGMSVSDFINSINDNLVRDENCKNELKFILKNTDSNLVYTVHYSQYKQRYGLYFRFLDEKTSKNLMEDKLSLMYINSNKLDTVQPGYGQYENDELHNMTEYGNGSIGQTYHGTSRYAKEGGSFSYRMIVDEEGSDLMVMFDPSDNGKTIKIKAGESVVYEEVIQCKDEKGFNKVIIPLSKEVITSAMERIKYDCNFYSVIKITISGIENKQSAQICEFMYTLKKKD